MDTRIVPFRIAEPECYICGSKDVKMLCHECKRPMCRAHGPNNIRVENFFRRVIDVEFTNLNLHKTLGVETGIHCKNCIHYVDTYQWMRIFFSLSGFLIVIGLLIPYLFGAIFLFFAATIFFILGVDKVRTRRQRLLIEFQHHKPLLPMIGQFITVNVREALEITISLSEEGEYKYEISPDSPIGKLEVASFLSESDRDRLLLYQEKYQITPEEAIDYHAGFVVLKGESKFYSNQSYTTIINPIALIGTINRDSFSIANDIEQRTTWYERIFYTFKIQENHNVGLPIQIIPNLISESSDWSMQFLLQTNPTMFPPVLSNPEIRMFKLNLFSGVRGIENRNPYGEIYEVNLDTEQTGWQVVWENISLDKEVGTENFRKYFSVRLKDSKNIDPKMVVEGEIELYFEGTLSGLEDVEFYTPLGSKFRENERISLIKKTKIKISFKFHLTGLKLYRIITRTQWRKKSGAIPVPEAITRLVKVLSEKKYYVQKVIENIPGASHTDARIVKRLWVLSGYYYEFNQPINFRIVARGIEIYSESEEPFDGDTEFKVVVRGVVIDEADEDLAFVQDEIIEIITQGPELDLKWFDKEFQLGSWEKLQFELSSNGKIPADEITYSLNGPSVKTDNYIKPIENFPESGGKSICTVNVLFEKDGDVPIILQVDCKDRYGKYAPRKWRREFKVHSRISED